MGFTRLQRDRIAIREKLDATTVQRRFDQMADLINSILERSALVDGELIADVSFTASTAVVVQHKLNRKPIGVIVVKTDAAMRNPAFSSPTTSELTLTASETATASVWIF